MGEDREREGSEREGWKEEEREKKEPSETVKNKQTKKLNQKHDRRKIPESLVHKEIKKRKKFLRKKK